MSADGGWLRHAAAAARLVGDRPDRWLPGSLGALGYLAWLPLLVSVAALPSPSDLAFFGARLLASGSFPWNLLLLAALATMAVLIGCLLAALAEAALLRAAGHGTPGRSLARETEVAFSVVLVAALPAVAVAAALVSAIASVAPAEFGAPDIGGPLLLRIASHLVPLLVAMGALTLAGQAFGASAMRSGMGPDAVGVGAALRAGLRDLVTHPLRRLGTAAASTLIDLLALAVAIGLLQVLWAPIAADLAGGQLVSPRELLLLVGFVAVWLALVLVFGVLHAWISAWWSLELEQTDAAVRPSAQEASP